MALLSTVFGCGLFLFAMYWFSATSIGKLSDTGELMWSVFGLFFLVSGLYISVGRAMSACGSWTGVMVRVGAAMHHRDIAAYLIAASSN